MDRVFEKAFSRVHTTVAAHIPDPEAKRAAKALSAEEKLRQETAPMTAADAVARISLAFRDGDYFRLVLLSFHDNRRDLGMLWAGHGYRQPGGAR
jgi:hypothetical protein